MAGFIAGTCFAGDNAANFQKYLSQKRTLETVISLYDQSSYSAALPMVRKLVDGSNPVAEYYYAASLQYGWGVPQNIDRSNEISKRVFPRVYSFAMKGDAVAQYVTGLMYRSGKGVEKDYAKAAVWFRKAGNQGYAQAQLNLGLLYRNGQGVERSAVEAVTWYRKAAERGDTVAQYNLGAMYNEGIGVLKDSAEAFKWCRKAAEQGYPDAQYQISGMYFKGIGVQEDKVEAGKWLRKAADQGHARAVEVLKAMKAAGNAVQ